MVILSSGLMKMEFLSMPTHYHLSENVSNN